MRGNGRLNSRRPQAKESLRVLTWARQLSKDGTAPGLFGKLFFNVKTHGPGTSRTGADEAGE